MAILGLMSSIVAVSGGLNRSSTAEAEPAAIAMMPVAALPRGDI